MIHESRRTAHAIVTAVLLDKPDEDTVIKLILEYPDPKELAAALAGVTSVIHRAWSAFAEERVPDLEGLNTEEGRLSTWREMLAPINQTETEP